MILIVGGSCQGKLTFAGRLLRERGRESFSVADGRTDAYESAYEADIVCHMESYIRRLMEDKAEPVCSPSDCGAAGGFIEGLIEKKRDVIVIADEIGYGIVPVSGFMREYRENEGRLCQRLAAESAAVYRVVCGIGTKIKG